MRHNLGRDFWQNEPKLEGQVGRGRKSRQGCDRLNQGDNRTLGVESTNKAILKWADTPIRMLGGLWDEERRRWLSERTDDPRPPVYIIICKTTRIAKVAFEWLAEDKPPTGIPPALLPELRNRDGRVVTIRVDTKVVEDTDTGIAKSDEMAWMRFTLDTVGHIDWTRDRQGKAIYPEGFEDLAIKLGRPLHPPGRDDRPRFIEKVFLGQS